MKRIAKTILGCACFAAIILAGAVLSGLGWKKLEEAK